MPAYDPDSEVNGRYLAAFVESAGEVSPVFERKVRQIFERHLPPIEEGEWYRTEPVATAFDDVQEEIGPKTMKEGGIEGTKAVPWPDDIESIPEALTFLQQAHREAYRNSSMENPAGNYTFTETDERAMLVGITEGFPAPPGWAEGVFEYVAKEFGPEDASVRLTEKTPDDDQAAAWELLW
jgi:hypothetical protein